MTDAVFCLTDFCLPTNLFFSTSFSSKLTFAKSMSHRLIRQSPNVNQQSFGVFGSSESAECVCVCVCVYVLVNVRLRDARISMETDINRAVFGLLALAAGLVQWEERCERWWRTDLSACVWITYSSSVWPCRRRSQSVFLRPGDTHRPQTHHKLSAVTSAFKWIL